MTGRFGKLLIPGLVWMNLSLTLHLMGETEAAFSTQETSTMAYSMAFVFPYTIQQLEEQAKVEAEEIGQLYQGYKDLNLEEALLLKEKVVKGNEALQTLHTKMESYYQEALNDPKEYHYVIEGFLNVDKLVGYIDAEGEITRLESYIESLRGAGETSVEGKKRDEEGEPVTSGSIPGQVSEDTGKQEGESE
ncbi:DUF4047 domain-containing protein [Rossellomorea vietnamensis]|uniref:DUF4047 domain-containing protein n=1 Tax=Rossellomorea vietnamensis TaxID=218284 RepID=UPI001E4EB21D|nr:DUF4047 domain-containing protein [Rossellomorea vietnamensis]MCC5802206.1 DUF4047 domain-containing protein [Rossellomorea vietnamensis]